ncbi:H-NS family nucleoid-associated regulatory protein [Tritonibacter scottomollicae]|uniref:H-NS histone family protein n=1 Tax=Tritonibacter scottomollicae TaxID=483013 RepID=UPI003BA8A4DD
MNINLVQLSRTELEVLAKDIKARMVELEKENKERAYTEMLAIAAKYEVSFQAVVDKFGKATKKSTSKGVPRYANPNDPSQTWTGRGRRPTWLTEAVQSGIPIEVFEVKS